MHEQITLHGQEAYPIDGGLEYDLDDGSEILIRKMPDDPDGLDWSELLNIVAGLWEYIVTGMRYRPVTFDVLDIEIDAQIGWGHIVNGERNSIWNTTAKRDVQMVTPALLSSANMKMGWRNSSLLGPIDWPVKDSDMNLRFSTFRGQRLDPEEVKNFFIVLTKVIQNKIADRGEGAPLGSALYRFGNVVVLEVFDSSYRLTWGQLGEVILGLIDFMVDHDHNKSYHFMVFVGNPKVEIGFGTIRKGFAPQNNVTLARRSAVNEGGAG